MPARRTSTALTRQLSAIHAMRGVLKQQPGEPAFADEMARWKAEDREIEQRHENFLMGISPNRPRNRAGERKSPRR